MATTWWIYILYSLTTTYFIPDDLSSIKEISIIFQGNIEEGNAKLHFNK